MKKPKHKSFNGKEVTMPHQNKKVFNIKNTATNGVLMLLLTIALLGHHVIEIKATWTLP